MERRIREGRRRRIPARDRVLLSSWEKWQEYGRFPWKLVLQICLVVLTTWQIVRFHSKDAGYVRAAHRNWYYYFFPQEYDFESRNFYLYTVSDTVESIARTTRSYEQIVRTSVDQLSHPSKDAECLEPEHCLDGRLEVLRFSLSPNELYSAALSAPASWLPYSLQDDMVRETYWINGSDIGPFDFRSHTYEQVGKFVQSLVSMRLSYRLVAHGPRHTGRECLIWEIGLVYDFKERGQINLLMDSKIVDDCVEPVTLLQMLKHVVHQVNVAILVLSCLSLVLSVRSLYRSAHLLYRFEKKFKRRLREGSIRSPARFLSGESEASYSLLQDQSPALTRSVEEDTEMAFSGLPWRDKLRFFNLWFLLSAVAAGINIFNALFGLFWDRQYVPPEASEKFLLGIGCSLLWVNLIAFLTHKPSYNTIVLTLSRAIPRVARFLLGVLPILLGYALFGMLYFGDHSERFGSFGLSMITLFAVLNGDVIRETFMDLVAFYPVVSQLYLYSFISLFIYVVLNVLIAIVEESFFSTRAKARSLEVFAKQVREEEEFARQQTPDQQQEQQAAPPTSRVVGEDSMVSETSNAAPTTGYYNTFGSRSTDSGRAMMHQGGTHPFARDDSYISSAQDLPVEDQEHRRLRWFREVLHELENETHE